MLVIKYVPSLSELVSVNVANNPAISEVNDAAGPMLVRLILYWPVTGLKPPVNFNPMMLFSCMCVQLFIRVVQYDLWAPNLFVSAVVLEEVELPSFGIVGSPQLAPDGKLYIPTHYGVSHGPSKVFVIS